ncbi:MAG: alpha/beta hydrolase [Bacteroidota bacterium]
MKKTMRQYPIVCILSLLVATGWAQERVIKVWPQGAPGAIENSAYKPETIYINGNIPRLTKVTDPTLEMYPAPVQHSSGTAVIICPGGGYGRLAIDHEGSVVAAKLNQWGITAFVLKYRLPSDAIMKQKNIGPLQDGQEAVRIVRRHAAEWNINPHKIGIMGFSAGGHLAATVSTLYGDSLYTQMDTTSARPDFSILVYPVISMDSTVTHGGSRINLLGEHPSEELMRRFSSDLLVTPQTPPAFLVQAVDDPAVPIENSIRYLIALRKNKVPAELHLYESGGHGFGLGKSNGTESSWPEACKRWLISRGLL